MIEITHLLVKKFPRATRDIISVASLAALSVLFFEAELFSGGLTVGDALLRMPVSAESAGLGMVKVFDTRSGGNPAYSAIVFSTATVGEITFGYASTALGVRILEAGGRFKKGRFLGGFSFYQQNAGDAEIHRLPFETAVEELIFTRNLQTDNVFSFALGYELSQNFSLGLAPRYLYSRILDEYTLSSFSFDAGLAFRAKFIRRPLIFTALVSNVGAEGNYSGVGTSSEKFPLPLTYSGGISYAIFNFANIMFYEDYLSVESKTSWGYAVEFRFPDEKVYPLNTVRLRLGWRLPYSGRSSVVENAAAGFSVGFSEYALDYAFVPLDDAGFTHRVGITYRFGHKEVIPQQNIVETAKITFVSGKFEENSFIKLEDIAQLLKEKPTYLVRVEGDLENVDKVMDYFVNTERLPENIFVTTEKDIEWVDVILIKK